MLTGFRRNTAAREGRMSAWDASVYLQFADERTQPAIDLVARVALAAPGRIVDLGCGPGNSTAILRRRWPGATLVGLDNSPEMIAAATKDFPQGTWLQADLATWRADAPFDLVFANATLQWLPGHAALFPRLLAQVAPGGALAVQMPARIYARVQQLLLDLADEPIWRDRLVAARGGLAVGTPAFYYDLLRPYAARLDLWETEYVHLLDSPAAIIDWIRGTRLRTFLAALADDAERRTFQARLLDAVVAAYPPQRDRRLLFPFRRLFLVAYR